MEEMSAAGTRPILVAADVSQEDQVGAMFEQTLGEYGRIDFLINTAVDRRPGQAGDGGEPHPDAPGPDPLYPSFETTWSSE
jgi:NAD(P)-dependent dehydrogenase (short-subunit alcohol dehydrogenase family)